MKQTSGIAKNSAMLMAMNIAKMIFPLLTLPYLTRVLSKDCYGSVVYVKSVITYLQILVDFGFVLSATKDIVRARQDKAAQEKIIGDVLLAPVAVRRGARRARHPDGSAPHTSGAPSARAAVLPSGVPDTVFVRLPVPRT